ncbi:hypothetical protein J4H92_00785 [Leucobacter weissii]|uniref:Peptidase C45 hydrolase domain-containing protein n=1 Tax=Leucobacter weissii TaxID=1983706 RepID=A0A939MH21_9MICO|nr:C45 family peptidase [Leucobacter weissii]MBO1900481.1 hypothetical protein [Leucobacter weissii]
MTAADQRRHLHLAAPSRAELGRVRGAALASSLPRAVEQYTRLFRAVGVNEAQQRQGAELTLEGLGRWRPELIEELEGIAAGSGAELLDVAALNARTEILAMSGLGVRECSTVSVPIDGRRVAIQTWDWHVELAEFWHTQEVAGPGHRYAGLTEQGILSKIGLNEEGLALHFNILGHRRDGAGGVPMHMLSALVLSECASVDEALALIREAPVTSSSAFTLIDADRAVSVEITPVGVFAIPESRGSVQRTNHFLDPTPLAEQRTEVYEPDSSERLDLIRQRLDERRPRDEGELVELLLSGDGEPPLCCRPDMTKPLGDRWGTLATVITDPERRTIRLLDGMPSDAATGEWRELRL